MIARLKAAGVDAQTALETGALSIHPTEDSYLHTGTFDPDAMRSFWEESLAKARDVEGYTGVRAAAEMSWALVDGIDADRLAAYEATLNRLSEGEAYTVLCQYDRDRFPADVLADVLHTHPFVIYDGTVCENHFYHEPEAFLEAGATTTDVQPILDGLLERTRTELTLDDRERDLEQYRALTAAANDVIVTIDGDAVIRSINAAVADVFGYDPDSLVGESLTTLMPDRLADRQRRTVERYLETDRRTLDRDYLEVTGRHADGSELPLAVSFSQVETDEEACFTGIISDISERRAREAEMNRLLDPMRQTEAIADVGGWEIDPETGSVFWCDQLFDILGIDDDDEPPLEAALDVYHETDRDRVERAIDRALTEGTSIDLEARFRRPADEVRWLHIRGEPEVEDGEVVALRGAAQDVTARKRRERDLEASRDRLEEFAAAVSHDLRKPLRTMASYLQLLERRYEAELDDDAAEFIDFAVDSASRMQEMIDGLVTTYARLDAGEAPFEPVDLNDVLADVRADLAPRLAETDADLTVASLPTIAGDRGQLRQLFMNLLDNAIKYAGEASPTIRVTAERSDGRYRVSVEDDGIGLDPVLADTVFEVFSRAHPEEEYPGTGIGLAICERIVQRHDGEIWVDSRPGAGATFTFSVPQPATGQPTPTVEGAVDDD